MAKCAFGKILLRGTFEPEWEYGTELYARMFYVENDHTKSLLVALDTSCTSHHDCTRFRQGVAKKTGIPAEGIWYHELQIHAAPECRHLAGKAMDLIIDRVANEARAMMERAVPFTCDVSHADLGNRFSMNREQYVEGLGGVTIWAGMRFDEEGRPYCNDPGRMLLRGYTPELPVFEKPIYFDNTVDSKAYLFVFRDDGGKIIGTMSRFAAHPDVSVLFESKGVHDHHYDFDWPGYLSEKLEKAYQAPSMYVNGPCADLATKKGWDGMDDYLASTAESKRIGEALADELISQYDRKHIPMQNADCVRAATFTVELPMRDTYPHSFAELPETLEIAAQREIALQKGMEDRLPAYAVKRLIDDRWREGHSSHSVRHACGFEEEELIRHSVKTTVAVLQLGDYLFIGVPGESLVDMTMWLRSTFTGAKTIPLDQVNGYYNYMATPRSLTLGGYTYWASWVRRDAVPILKEGILKFMENWLEA